MPRIAGDGLQFIYQCDPTRVVDEQARTIVEAAPAIAAHHFRGGSQAIAFDGGSLAIVHEVQARDFAARRFYLHPLAWVYTARGLRPRSLAALPQIHCFYEVLSGDHPHHGLVAATSSMRAAGHPVTVWSYSPARLDFLRAHGIAVQAADDVVPRGLFERILAASEIRYFSDIFRYAVLYEHGGLWMDCDVVLLRPFPFRGDHFINLQWRGGHVGHFVCGNVMYAEPHSRHLRRLYEISIDRFFQSPGS